MSRAIRRLPTDCVYQIIDSPLGALLILVREKELHGILWHSDLEDGRTAAFIEKLAKVAQHRLIDRVAEQLNEYFFHGRQQFDLPIIFNGTDFQQQVWQALLDIPFGQCISYQQQAINIGGKEKVRAVGTANGANPISIVVPCHRVMGKNGSLTGYAGGLDAKSYLQRLEGGLPGGC